MSIVAQSLMFPTRERTLFHSDTPSHHHLSIPFYFLPHPSTTYQRRIKLHHRPRVQHGNPVVVHQGEDAMGNGQEGRPLELGADRLLDQSVRLRVHCLGLVLCGKGYSACECV